MLLLVVKLYNDNEVPFHFSISYAHIHEFAYIFNNFSGGISYHYLFILLGSPKEHLRKRERTNAYVPGTVPYQSLEIEMQLRSPVWVAENQLLYHSPLFPKFCPRAEGASWTWN